MTGTSVKNVGSALMNLAVSQAGKSAVSAGGFQQVWSRQMNRSTADNTVSDSSADQTKQLQRGSSLKAKESQTERKEGPQEAEELSPEEQERAVEVLNTAALELMQEIADAFGMSVEELQTVMEDLNMEQTDLLDVSKLASLVLNLGGAQDASVLLTDGELYDTYRMLMEKQSALVQESAEALETEPSQLFRILEEGLGKEIPAEELHVPQELRADGSDAPGQQTMEGVDGESVQTANAGDSVQGEQEARNQNGAGAETEGKDSGEKSERGQQVNLFAQDFRMQFQPELQQGESAMPEGPWSENTQEIMDQILDYMKLQLNSDTTRLEMQLHPASLGTIQIQLASRAGAVTANFIAQNESVKAALETQMVQLREQFEEQGIKVAAIEVTVQTHEFERNLDV